MHACLAFPLAGSLAMYCRCDSAMIQYHCTIGSVSGYIQFMSLLNISQTVNGRKSAVF